MVKLPHALASDIDRLAAGKILCVGDLMLDRFIYGSVDRISPEAPIPVFSIREESTMLGGAGNVVRNVLALGANATFLSVVGDDPVGRELTAMIGREERLQPYLMVERGRISTKKTRYIAASQQLLRADAETRAPIASASEEQMLSVLEGEISRHDVLVLSDYGKGTLTRHVAQSAIAAARKAGKCVLVDPKSRDFSLYAGATLICPNLAELSAAAGREIASENDIVAAARELMTQHNMENMLVTRGRDGMTLVTGKGNPVHLPAHAREVFDVSGAGDTVIATYACAAAAGMDLATAAYMANLAAGIVVGKMGTAVVYRTDLKTALHAESMLAGQHKILPFEPAKELVEQWKRQGLTIGFTNGCFDLIHPGHLSLLQETKRNCDRLVVGLNSDDSVSRLKGPTRPVNSEMERATVLAAMHSVDMIVVFREDTPMKLLEAFRPHLLAKGADYTKDQVVGAKEVESWGGKILLVPVREGYSTTATIAKIG